LLCFISPLKNLQYLSSIKLQQAMSKSGKSQPEVKLSPENYIRQRARLLPVYECLVNKDWQKSKIGAIIIARKHVNGNVTVGTYLVDLLCLGVKDTSYAFNIPLFEYQDKFVHPNIEFDYELDKIDYTLAHNIVFAGVDFAANIGFKPHPDFQSTTRFILEEDDDNVALIEVECGKNGLPVVIMGEENKKECMKIIAQLDKLVGKENYRVYDVNNLEADEPDEEVEEYTQEQFEADKRTFKKTKGKFTKMSPDELTKFFVITRRLFFYLVDDSEVEKAYDDISKALNVVVSYKNIPDEFLGMPSDAIKDVDWLKSTMLNAFNPEETDKTARQLYTNLHREYPDMPAMGVLDLYLSMHIEKDAYLEMVKAYRIKFPSYKLFDIMQHYTEISMSKTFDDELLDKELSVSDFFNGRESLFWVEMYYFIKLYSLHTLAQVEPIRIGALYEFLHEEYLPKNATVLGKYTALVFMVNYIEESIFTQPSGFISNLKTAIFNK